MKKILLLALLLSCLPCRGTTNNISRKSLRGGGIVDTYVVHTCRKRHCPRKTNAEKFCIETPKSIEKLNRNKLYKATMQEKARLNSATPMIYKINEELFEIVYKNLLDMENDRQIEYDRKLQMDNNHQQATSSI